MAFNQFARAGVTRGSPTPRISNCISNWNLLQHLSFSSFSLSLPVWQILQSICWTSGKKLLHLMILFTSFHHFLGHKNERNCSSPGSGQHHGHTAQVRSKNNSPSNKQPTENCWNLQITLNYKPEAELKNIRPTFRNWEKLFCLNCFSTEFCGKL